MDIKEVRNRFLNNKNIPASNAVPKPRYNESTKEVHEPAVENTNSSPARIIEMPLQSIETNTDTAKENNNLHDVTRGSIIDRYVENFDGVPAITQFDKADNKSANNVVVSDEYLDKLDKNVDYQLALVPKALCEFLKEVVPVPMHNELKLDGKTYVLVQVNSEDEK